MAVKEIGQLERERFGPPMAGSFMLHLLLAAAIAIYAFIAGRLHGSEWGNNKAPGAIQATLVSSAPTLPLPQDTPPTPNVLATETPSPAPAPPQPKAEPVPQPDAIPIPVKAPPKKAPEKKAQPSPQHAQPQPQQHRAQYGEAPPTQIPHSTAGNPGQNNPINITGGGQGFDYPYYVGIIQRKVREAWYTQEVDPRTSSGSQARVIFSISRDGTPSNVRISKSSGSPTLDTSAMRAVQRVESFGPLPPGYSGSYVSVEYTFSYDQPTR